MKYIVSKEEHGKGLLSFLSEKNRGVFSVKALKAAIAAKRCKVSGRPETFCSRKLFAGEEVEFEPLSWKSPPPFLEKLFEDRDFIVVNKPAGVVSEPGSFPSGFGVPVHRLDKETSGALLLAKTVRAEEAGKALFASRSVRKRYLAVVAGTVSFDERTIEGFLGRKAALQGQTIYGSVREPLGKRAVTRCKAVVKGRDASLVLCEPKTGRTHQIRVHLAEAGYPIVGDLQYGSVPSPPGRHLLHAWTIGFVHPFTGNEVAVEAPVPEDFLTALRFFGIVVDDQTIRRIDERF